MVAGESEVLLAFIKLEALSWTEEKRASTFESINEHWLAEVIDPCLPGVK